MSKLYRFFPLVLLITLISLFFVESIFLDHTFISSGMILTDLYLFNYPLKSLMHQSLLSGQGVPLWTDLIGNGYPIFAEGQMGGLYPFHLLFFSIPISTIKAFNLNLILHLVLSGVFMYQYINKSIKVHKYASVLGALVFALCGYMLTHLHQVNIILVISYFPINLLIIERIFSRHNLNLKSDLLTILMISLAFYAQLNAGHIEMVYYNLLFSTVYAILRLFIDPNTRSKMLGKMIIVLVGLTIALALSLPQLTSTYELVEFSQREQGLSYEHTTGTLWPVETLILFINPKAYNVYRDEPGYNPSKIETVNIGALYPYIGIVPLLLAVFAISTLFINHRKLNKQYKHWIILYTALLLLTYFYAVGRSTQLFTVIWEIIPGLKYFRFPIKAIYIIEFSLAVLAAIGAALIQDIAHKIGKNSIKKTNNEDTQSMRFSQKNSSDISISAASSSVNFAVNSLPHQQNAKLASVTMILLIAVSFSDLFVNNRPIQPTIPAKDWLEVPDFAQFIQEAALADQGENSTGYTDWRSYSHGTNNIDYTRIFDFKLQKDLQNILHVDFNMVHNIPINREWAVLFLQRQTELNKFNTRINIEEGFLTLPAELKKSLDIQSVRFLLSDLPIDNPDLTLVRSKVLSSQVDHVVFLSNSLDATKIPTQTLYLYENATYLPRLRIVDESMTKVVEPIDSKATNVLNELLSTEHNPEVLILEKGQVNNANLQSSTKEKAKLLVTDYSPNKILVTTDSSQDSYLTISDTYYPGWSATIDGKPTEILRANYAFRAIKVPAGQHSIVMQFQPTYLQQSTAIAFGGVVLILLITATWLCLQIRHNVKSSN